MYRNKKWFNVNDDIKNHFPYKQEVKYYNKCMLAEKKSAI